MPLPALQDGSGLSASRTGVNVVCDAACLSTNEVAALAMVPAGEEFVSPARRFCHVALLDVALGELPGIIFLTWSPNPAALRDSLVGSLPAKKVSRSLSDAVMQLQVLLQALPVGVDCGDLLACALCSGGQ
ncbi:unnamed protein product [Symbiodinium natans]|uniref:Uncharacterized protein n=1 Tax=Symbiodinium natans TaxID=878477 RepID=A0A812I9X3_9DINO|nr:unnamed protein product [Symbiodinium natans]